MGGRRAGGWLRWRASVRGGAGRARAPQGPWMPVLDQRAENATPRALATRSGAAASRDLATSRSRAATLLWSSSESWAARQEGRDRSRKGAWLHASGRWVSGVSMQPDVASTPRRAFLVTFSSQPPQVFSVTVSALISTDQKIIQKINEASNWADENLSSNKTSLCRQNVRAICT